MRRVFVIRKDLNLRPGKLAAMVGHCAEAYWTSLLKKAAVENPIEADETKRQFIVKVPIDQQIWNEYALGIFTKTICECKNKDRLQIAVNAAKEIGLVEGIDYGFINDCCLTELTPENPDGTTTIGIWFRPLPDDQAHKISKKFKLYGVFDK